MKDTQPRDLTRSIADLHAELAGMERFVAEGRTRLEVLVREAGGAADPALIRAYIRKPWCVLPKGPTAYWLIVPIWSNVHAGWLHQATESHRIFVVDRYSQWFGQIPEPLQDALAFGAPVAATVKDGVLTTDARTAKRLKPHLGETIKAGAEWRVRPGHEFALLAELIEMGAMPFSPTPVAAADIRVWKNLAGPLATLWPEQKDAWHEFLAYGAIGVYWPMSGGKTVIGCYAFARLAGKKLLVVPSRTLKEQWIDRITRWAGAALLREVDIITYAAYHKVAKRKYTLAVFDECHRLPANTFARFATVAAKYRLGLSATPFREDGRTNYIIALTGRPVGVDWGRFTRDGRIRPPDVHVRILKTQKKKIAAAIAEVKSAGPGRRLVFADTLAIGRAVAKRLGCPFVSGTTKDRLKVLAANQTCVISRVGDEGVSLPDLVKVVELDFHGGSRRQEMQRVGRLFHRRANGRGKHVVLMTEDEYRRYGRRFLAIEEKGIKIKIHDET